ncbi:unnamed protein product [Schistocephalus solidus]|uniref:Secreted protein n=1 Tax=Schistocephalus solidus TaxID=70667 RepID=A0A183TC07_SCHSO|nr:unnamed protein product [Schistocephalus solidus]
MTAYLPIWTVLSFVCFLFLIESTFGQQRHIIRRARKIVSTDIGHVNLPSYVRDDAMKVLDEGSDAEDNDIIPALPENAGVPADSPDFSVIIPQPQPQPLTVLEATSFQGSLLAGDFDVSSVTGECAAVYLGEGREEWTLVSLGCAALPQPDLSAFA